MSGDIIFLLFLRGIAMKTVTGVTEMAAVAADRLSGQEGGAGLRVRCWYCQRVQPWWTCDCPDARAIRDGKKAGPRTEFREGRLVIVLDEETVRRNEALGLKRYRPSVTVHEVAQAHRHDEAVDSVDICGQDVDTDAVHTEGEAPDTEATRRLYKAEWMRRRRAERKSEQ